MSYQAICAKLTNVRPHPNADRLKLATVCGYQVVVGLDSEEGELGVFFACDGQLSEEYATANDLVQRKNPETGEREGGFFAKNRRVRSQNFRGEKSEGYFAPLSSFECAGDVNLKDGDQFDTLGKVPICNKYITPATQSARGSQSRKRENTCFAKHVDTKYLKRELYKIQAGDTVIITEKLHGTSGRFGHVLDEELIPRTWIDWLLRRQRTRVVYKHLLGTRNVILKDRDQQGFYGDENFRWKAVEHLIGNLHKGEILYFELVGFDSADRPIMSQHSTDKVPQFKKDYGNLVTYSYGQVDDCALYVYRITRVNEDGDAIELPWCQVKARCDELGIKHVPELDDVYTIHTWEDVIEHEREVVMRTVESHLQGNSTLCHAHPREGVVVRLEGATTRFLKEKSFEFGLMEGYLKENDNYVDLEEIS